jgi:hypothetical protein
MGEALDSWDCIPIGCESDPEPGWAKHWIAVIGSRLVVNHPMLLPYHFNPQHLNTFHFGHSKSKCGEYHHDPQRNPPHRGLAYLAQRSRAGATTIFK